MAAPGSRSDAIIQSEDLHPTLIGAEPAFGDSGKSAKAATQTQRFDGHSILPALKGDALAGKAVFQYFPHNPGVPDWLPPAVSVHRDDWKLIRLFHGGEKGAHRHLLFNLRDDLGEKNNLAAQQPRSWWRELDASIDGSSSPTRRPSCPVPNPGFRPREVSPRPRGRAEAQGQGGSQKQSRQARRGSRWRF